MFNLLIKYAFMDAGGYYYFLPTYRQAKKIIWDGITNDGKKFLDYIPKPILLSQNSQELMVKIRTMDGRESIIQLIGTDLFDSLRGPNPKGCIFSEYAYQNSRAWDVVRPVLRINNGFALFNTTPNGKNHAHKMYITNKNNPKWFTEVLTIRDTGVLTDEDIAEERAEGMIEEMIQQEYFCSFDVGVLGSYYNKQLEESEANNRICSVPYDNILPTYAVLDLGRSDSTAVAFFQVLGKEVRVIETFEHNGEGIGFYIEKFKACGYRIEKIFLPHDAFAKRIESKKSVAEQVESAGYKVARVPDASLQNGIQELRRVFPRIFFDKDKTKGFREALENYHREYDNEKKIFKDNPLHDWSSHYADCGRYLALSLPLVEGVAGSRPTGIKMRTKGIHMPQVSTKIYKV